MQNDGLNLEIMQLVEDTRTKLEEVMTKIDTLFDRLEEILNITELKQQVNEL